MFPTQDAFNDRIRRATRSELREQFGTDDPEVIKQKLKRVEELEAAEAERARATMTEQQKLQADLNAANAAKVAAEAERDARRFEAHVNDLCARNHITNTKYARFLVSEAAEALPTGQQLDAEAFLKEKAADPQVRSAFGIVEHPPATVPQPVTTSPNPTSPPPPAPPPGGGGPALPDVMAMSKPQFQQHLAKHGVG